MHSTIQKSSTAQPLSEDEIRRTFKKIEKPDNPFQVDDNDDKEFWLVKFPSTFNPELLTKSAISMDALQDNNNSDENAKIPLIYLGDYNSESKDDQLKISFIERPISQIQNIYPLVYDSMNKDWVLGKRFARNLIVTKENINNLPSSEVLPASNVIIEEQSLSNRMQKNRQLKMHVPPVGFGMEQNIMSHQIQSESSHSQIKMNEKTFEEKDQKKKKDKKEKKDKKKKRKEKDEGYIKQENNDVIESISNEQITLMTKKKRKRDENPETNTEVNTE